MARWHINLIIPYRDFVVSRCIARSYDDAEIAIRVSRWYARTYDLIVPVCEGIVCQVCIIPYCFSGVYIPIYTTKTHPYNRSGSVAGLLACVIC